jgi:hypothetical protein
MTLLEKKQNKLIELLHSQVVDLTMMSKIELGDDVIAECNRISEEIQDIKENYVPFISEVEEFNAIMGNLIIIPRTYLMKKSGCLSIILF